jgi:hypothetical protein
MINIANLSLLDNSIKLELFGKSEREVDESINDAFN